MIQHRSVDWGMCSIHTAGIRCVGLWVTCSVVESIVVIVVIVVGVIIIVS